ncbi:MAG: hypothetical protein ACRDPX_01380 [Gaiellaceae bacterium]
MRLVACAALVVAGLTVSGCGNDVDVELVWGGPPDAEPGGAVSTQGFSGFQQEVDAEWERSPAMAAGIFLRLDERKAVRTTIDAKAGPEGGGDQIVIVTLDGLADDSVRTERWTLGFEEAQGGVYALTGALRELRCHEGRGHQNFAGEACI